MGTPLSPTITLVVVPSKLLARVDSMFTGPSAIRKVMFYLQTVQGERRCFYECSYEDCPGCGCPSFEVDSSLDVPVWVLDHLRQHVQFYHGAQAGSD